MTTPAEQRRRNNLLRYGALAVLLVALPCDEKPMVAVAAIWIFSASEWYGRWTELEWMQKGKEEKS